MQSARSILATILVGASISAVYAQTTAGAGSALVIPLVAHTASFSTEVTVRNPNVTGPIAVNVHFYEALNSGTPGARTCATVNIPANESKQFLLGDQCAPFAAGGHFGMLVLEDAAAEQTNLFFAYSRTQTPGFIGFSVEGLPVGAFSGAPADSLGLKSQAAAPGFTSNCFVGALSEAVSYQLLLRDDSTKAFLGDPLTGTLQPYEMLRYLDVFGPSNANAPGDHSNVRANFTVTSGGQALVGFCTLQENSQLSADFRLAKSIDAMNNGQKRLACIGQDNCGIANGISATQPETITVAEGNLRRVYSMIITHPDVVRCDLVAAPADLANLQMRLRVPGDPFASAVFTPDVGYDGGGAGETSFFIYTGGRNAINLGTATRWFVDVETRTGTTLTDIKFGITCSSGNGVEVPWFRGTAAYAAF
ncbi:MAG TPA: hypothetical protein VLI21_08190 [Casimicrobiaceae bacterium]|nr:hypothetical protein [Casimicrobiaceae bacterium]